MKLDNAAVWLVGASSGIGAALAIELARAGARLAISARNAERLELVAQRCRDAGGNAHFLPIDLSLPETFPDARARVEAMIGVPDLLFLNAGQGQRGLALETPPEVVRRLFEVDFFGVVELARQAAPAMVERGSGRIAVTTSLLGKFGATRRSAYSAAKHALHGWFDSLRLELDGTGVGVTLFCPGYIHTEIGLHALTPEGRPYGKLDVQPGRGITSEECARRMAKTLRKDPDEQLVGGIECGGAYLKRFFPGLLKRVMRRVKMS